MEIFFQVDVSINVVVFIFKIIRSNASTQLYIQHKYKILEYLIIIAYATNTFINPPYSNTLTLISIKIK